MSRRILVALALTMMLSPAARASCGSSSCPIELHPSTDSGMTLDLSFQYIDQNELRTGTTFGGAEEHHEVRTINRLTALQLSAPVSSRFQFGLTLPFVDRWHEHLETASASIERWSFHSLGDIALQMRARVATSLWLTTSLKLPTGDEHVPALGGGDAAEVTIAPGSGSTDVAAGLSYQGRFVRSTTLSGELGHATAIPYFASAVYRRNGRGTQSYRIGDELMISAGSEYPVSRRVDLLGQVNARVKSKDDPGDTGENRDLTGGRYLFASPGIRVDIGRNAGAYAYVQIPLVQHVNGSQLTARANYLVGVRQHF